MVALARALDRLSPSVVTRPGRIGIGWTAIATPSRKFKDGLTPPSAREPGIGLPMVSDEWVWPPKILELYFREAGSGKSALPSTPQ